ncbi:PREDICTED: uncharacterized protein LOC108768052 [Trachymyrmex cornetzi]|uniref:uncharacterized protein LOC108768052 n=1 Tax=Trachymyrmex cornetzi TaxID=471704 RepID=UPI00084F7A6E|nr:PREDICTED: uncharacterized protein LOC108768052 [Trachymyrmex cornetzi]
MSSITIQIAKSAETDFEQNMLKMSIFYCRKDFWAFSFYKKQVHLVVEPHMKMIDLAQFFPNLLSDYISNFCSISALNLSSGYAADSIQFLLPICWHKMLADFVDRSLAKCGHKMFSFVVRI